MSPLDLCVMKSEHHVVRRGRAEWITSWWTKVDSEKEPDVLFTAHPHDLHTKIKHKSKFLPPISKRFYGILILQ